MMALWDKSFDLLARAGRRRVFWFGFPLVLYIGSLGGPFQIDDLNLVLKTERYLRGERPRLALFEWAPDQRELQEAANRGSCPWWVWSGMRVAFFRPLAEWSFYADMALFGRNAFAHRLISLGWFLIALVCVHRLYLRVSGDLTFAGVATLLFGMSEGLAAPVAFICNRADLFVLIGSTLTAHAYWSARTRQDWKLAIVAALGFIVALLAKEPAMPLVGVIVGYEVLARWRKWPTGGSRMQGIIAGVMLVVAATYVLFYVTTRSGPAVSKDWTTLVFLAMLIPKSLGLYLAVWTTGFPVSALQMTPQIWPTVVVCLVGGALGLLTLRYLVPWARREAGGAFFLVWSAAFLSIAVLTIAEQRALCLSTIGWAYLLAGLLLPRRDGTPNAPTLLRHWLFTANGLISILCTLGTLAMANQGEEQAQDQMRGYVAGEHRPMKDGDSLIVAESGSFVEHLFAGDRLEWVTGLPHVSIAHLTVAGTGATVRRADDHTLIATSKSELLFESPLHKMMLEPYYKLPVGRTFRARDFMATIDAVENGRVTELRFRFDEPLTSPKYHFYPPSLAAIARGTSLPGATTSPRPPTSAGPAGR
jgi:hypothetical protein